MFTTTKGRLHSNVTRHLHRYQHWPQITCRKCYTKLNRKIGSHWLYYIKQPSDIKQMVALQFKCHYCIQTGNLALKWALMTLAINPLTSDCCFKMSHTHFVSTQLHVALLEESHQGGICGVARCICLRGTAIWQKNGRKRGQLVLNRNGAPCKFQSVF